MSSIGKAVGKVVGGITGSSAAAKGAEKASKTQAAYAQEGIEEQRRQFDQLTQLMAPFVEAGAGPARDASTLQSIVGFYEKYHGTTPKAETLQSWAQQIESGERTLSDVERLISSSPGAVDFAVSGRGPGGALQAQQALIGLRGPDEQQAAISAIEGSPAFTSLVQQGEEALLQNAAATGGLRGGNLQSALAQFRPQVLSQLIESQYGKLGGLTQLGQASAAGQASAGLQTGSNIANLLQQQGAARAGGQIAAGGAQRQAFGDLLAIGQTAAGFF